MKISEEMKNVVVITNPMIAAIKSAEVTLSKFLRVIKPSVGQIQVIGGNLSVEKDLKDIELISFPIVRHPNKLKRILSVIGIQLKMAKAINRIGEKGQPVYFWIADKMILPYFTAKIKGMEVNYFIYGNVEKEGTQSGFTALSGKLIRYMASHADCVCMESPSVKNEWISLKIKKKKIIYLYTNTVVEPEFQNRNNVFGMVCRLTPGKHVVECIRAMSEIHNLHPNWRLEIIGSGKQQRECENLVNELEAKDYISLIGWVEHSDLQNKVKSWKYLLFPTDTEGMPNGIIEMMGCGIPAIASPVGGISDVICSTNGFFLCGSTVLDLKEGMEKAIELSENEYAKMARNAYETINREYTLPAAQAQAKKWL